jgi:uncharacterized tellurite resistance protein B-like protein
MGIFGDLFKEKIDWSENEMKALLSVLAYTANIDGKVDQEEKDLMSVISFNTPGFKPTDWQKFAEEVHAIPAETHLEVLKNMHKDKRKYLVGTVALMGSVDGNLDNDEQTFFSNLQNMMEVKF